MQKPIASYLVNSQLITLEPEIPAFIDTESPRGFHGIHEIAYFFHEWIHYLHNVSTGYGITSFMNWIQLWHEFRDTVTQDKFCLGTPADSTTAHRLGSRISLLSAMQKPEKSSIPLGTPLELIEISSIEEITLENIEKNIKSHSIKLKISILNKGGDRANAEATLGPIEIIESVAFMLEARLVEKFGEKRAPAPAAPYCLLELLASHIDSSINEETALLCGLACLQNTTPAFQLVDLLKKISDLNRNGHQSSVSDALSKLVSRGLQENKEDIERHIKQIEDGFPLDEPMALSIKHTTHLMRENISKRIASPFFEISIIENIFNERENFDKAMRSLMEEYGACAIIQRKFGFENDIERDMLVDFLLSTDNNDIREGRRIAQAAFHFMQLHLSQDGFVETSCLPEKSTRKCPFYTSCTLSLRKEFPAICAHSPWLSTLQETRAGCWYAQGVRKSGLVRY